jgi:tetratricopeptide (TPR) repeat protein
VDYYDAYGTPNERMLAHYIKGCAYRDMGDQPASLRCYNDAVAAADTSRADCNYDQLSIIYGQIARIFRYRAMPDNALQAYEYAERYAWKAKDTIKVLTFWGNKSDALINQGKIKEGLHIKEEAAKEFHEKGNTLDAALTRGACIKWYIKEGCFEKAKDAMDEYEANSGHFTPKTHTDVKRAGYNYTKGLYYLGTGKLDSAEYFFRKLLHDGTTINDKYLAAWGMTQLYYNKEQMDSVGKYALQTFLHSDTLYNIGAAENLQNAQAMYNYDRHQEKALRKEMETKEARIRFYQLTLGVVLLAILLFLILYRKAKRNKQAIEGLNCLIAGLNDVISKNAADLQLKEKLEQSVNILEEKLETYRKEKEIHSQTHELNKLLQDPIVKRILEMGRIRKDYPSYNDWHILYTLMEEYYPKLAELRKDTNMLEYQICVLTKLGCKLSDIAHLTQTSNNNLAVIRGRMLKKIFHINEGGTKMFDQMVKEL